MTDRAILSERLALVPATPELVQAALTGTSALGLELGAVVPPTWPPLYLDRAALEFTLARLGEGAHHRGWWLHFVVLRHADAGRTLIGSAGYRGPPSAGTVELGYGIVEDHQRRGYASEAVRALVANAFIHPGVHRVIAETFPELVGSIGVLRKCGFRPIDERSEPGVIRFELTRAEHFLEGSGAPDGSERPR